MMREGGGTGAQGTFVIRILNRQNATWQGIVTCVDKKEDQSFRSLLELIKLIDSSFDEEKEAPSG
jgi:NADPH:quinone reductase-like Zn-dependent oxidoreductase